MPEIYTLTEDEANYLHRRAEAGAVLVATKPTRLMPYRLPNGELTTAVCIITEGPQEEDGSYAEVATPIIFATPLNFLLEPVLWPGDKAEYIGRSNNSIHNLTTGDINNFTKPTKN